MRVEDLNNKSTPIIGAGIKPVIHNVILLDCSSSMNEYSKCINAVAAIETEYEALEKDTNADYFYTVFCFASDDSFYANYFNNKSKYVAQRQREISKKDFLPAYGNTPLNDAIISVIGKLITDYASNPDEQVIIKIYTDGEENSSRATKIEAMDMVKTAEASGFIVTFIGTDRDVQNAIKDYGISVGNTMSYDGTGADLANVMYTSTINTMRFSKKMAKGESIDTTNLFNQDKKKKP